METLLTSIRASVQSENWHAALGLALTLPDICGRIDEPTKNSGQRYAAWFEHYLGPNYVSPHGPQPFMTGGDCYALRCAYFHQGEFDISTQRAKKILERIRFLVPAGRMTIHRNKRGAVLQLQVSHFCEEICQGVEAWLPVARGDTVKVARLAQLAEIEIMQPGQSIVL
jgi:hypothetical protein